MDLIDDEIAPAGDNRPEYSVSEISGALRRVIEGEFGVVRVRGEVGRVMLARTGHLYFDLKDDNNVLASVSWKGQVAKMRHRPEEGMEVVATGRLTTFGPQSKYQLNVEDVAPAGAGALMAMLDKRRVALTAEGLFAPERKIALPYLPEVIGVITSPTGAVIRDILHRLRDRFPRTVIVWPVVVQGANCAAEVARAINGFNALAVGGRIPRPDVLIVARGGGSIEDLWGFNEEIVVRAAAASVIPLISAVGHETDTTLIDHAADVRAPTPTAAAELAVPVRLQLIATVASLGSRLSGAVAQGVATRRQRLTDLARGLPRPEAMTTQAGQRLDLWAARLAPALRAVTARKKLALDLWGTRLAPAQREMTARKKLALAALALRPALVRQQTAEGRRRLNTLATRLNAALPRAARAEAQRLAPVAARLTPDLMARRFAQLTERLAGLDRLRGTLGYEATLKRGYAVVRDGSRVITGVAAAQAAQALEIQFADGRFAVGQVPGQPVTPPRKPRKGPEGQGSLF